MTRVPSAGRWVTSGRSSGSGTPGPTPGRATDPAQILGASGGHRFSGDRRAAFRDILRLTFTAGSHESRWKGSPVLRGSALRGPGALVPQDPAGGRRRPNG